MYHNFCQRCHANGGFILCKLRCILLQKCFRFSFNTWFEFVTWWLNASGSTCSDIILWVVILFAVLASGFAWKCRFFSSSMSPMVGSRCPTYSPLLNVMCLLLSFGTRILTDVLPLMLWMQFTMFLRSFPIVDLWSLMKYYICPATEWLWFWWVQCHYVWGGMLCVDLAIPIVTFRLQLLVYVRNLPVPLYVAILFFISSIW